jgi:acyl transferase domain-containing protein
MPKDRFNIDAFFHPDGTHKGTVRMPLLVSHNVQVLTLDQINAKGGYFLDQPLGHFDNEFFGISGKEAAAMDPQQRILLEVVYEALEDAGIPLEDVRGSNTSVYCGTFTNANDYNSLHGKDLEYYPTYAITGTGNPILSNRISYFYGFNGPSMTIDTACSSSLVGLHLGSQSLHNGEAAMAVIVGSALQFAPNVYQTLADMGFLSSDGRCRSFDADGSGYVRGDGICAIILKLERDALQCEDRIRAIVRATATNHDGKTDGITLPSSEAQEALIRSVYRSSGLDPDHTQFFEVKLFCRVCTDSPC